MKKNPSQLQQIANEVRKKILCLIIEARASHIGSAYSCIDVLTVLFENIFTEKDFDREKRKNIFILSKGWAVSVWYVFLARKGVISEGKLNSYCKDGSQLIGAATRNKKFLLDATTGSMGHGLPIAIGQALALRIKKKKRNVFVLISDGECDEGSVWEAALIAGHHKLSNLFVILDYNHLQSFGRTDDILGLEPLVKKWEAFNWKVGKANGHNYEEVENALKSLINDDSSMPKILIANTVKGKGSVILEDDNQWHYKTPTDEQKKIIEHDLKL